ncbi:protein transporter [Ascodesmis nigricans]|uniref:Mitochondrial import inner membrane translocase subunit TIM16 n=1 Tax=Ascodesmis nigricans TaxID=341454 RepID=A0A4S2MX31_9PEZI|nr:protein transporter [Ascodesmis nigricans]
MAQKLILAAAAFGTRVLGRAFTEAWQQAHQTQQYARAGAASQASSSNKTSPSMTRKHDGLTLSEACQILNVRPPQDGKANMDLVMERFMKLYDKNEPDNGGSFYLQSKILRARERIEDEVREKQEKEEREQEINEGWKPKMYRR